MSFGCAFYGMRGRMEESPREKAVSSGHGRTAIYCDAKLVPDGNGDMRVVYVSEMLTLGEIGQREGRGK